MHVGIIQSCYIPWRGYFDFIASVDLFVLFDDIQYPYGRSWRNRNQIKASTGLKWLTVPVKAGSAGTPIDQVLIGTPEIPWQTLHQRILKDSLGKAPYFKEAMDIWEEAVSGAGMYLSDLNLHLLRSICHYLKITTPIVASRRYAAQGVKTARLIDLLRKVGATSYLSGPAATAYLDEDAFRQAGIGLSYKTYDYEPYPQLWGKFEGAVTVLDLIANCGSESRRFIDSLSPDTVSIPPAR